MAKQIIFVLILGQTTNNNCSESTSTLHQLGGQDGSTTNRTNNRNNNNTDNSTPTSIRASIPSNIYSSFQTFGDQLGTARNGGGTGSMTTQGGLSANNAQLPMINTNYIDHYKYFEEN